MINKVFRPILEVLPENNKLERIWLLAKTDFKKRYYGTSLGIVWALINPFSQLLIYYYIFTVLFKTDIPNYTLYLFSGLIFWMLFSEATTKGMYTFHANRSLLENIKIKKHNILTAGILSTLFTFTFNALVFGLISLFFKLPLTIYLLYIPLLVLNLIILIYGINLILSVVYIYLRDFNHFWDIFIMAGFWLNPIVYTETMLYENKLILGINPIAGIVINMHNALIFGKTMDFNLLIWDFCYAIILFMMGVIVFNHYSKKVTEVL
jgi:ABC-2 type transport system permease protein